MLDAVFVVVALSTVAIAVRLFIGPTLLDRLVAFDAIAINIIVLAVLAAMRLDTPLFFDLAMLIAILVFVGTVAVAKYLMGGGIIHRRRD